MGREESLCVKEKKNQHRTRLLFHCTENYMTVEFTDLRKNRPHILKTFPATGRLKTLGMIR